MLAATLLTSAAAFAPCIKNTRTTFGLQAESTTAETRTVYDSFGLYPNDSEERANGRLQALEQENMMLLDKNECNWQRSRMGGWP